MKRNGKIFLPAASALLAAVLASTCCVAPFLAIAGFLGVSVSGLVWLSSIKPYLVTISLFSIGYSLFVAYRGKASDSPASCCSVPVINEKNTQNKITSIMRSKIFLWVLAALTVITLMAPYLSKAQQPKQVAAKEQIAIYHVEKLTQSCCVGLVEYSLKKVKGFIKQEADVNKREIRVWYNPSITNKEEINKAIDKSGYEAVPVS